MFAAAAVVVDGGRPVADEREKGEGQRSQMPGEREDPRFGQPNAPGVPDPVTASASQWDLRCPQSRRVKQEEKTDSRDEDRERRVLADVGGDEEQEYDDGVQCEVQRRIERAAVRLPAVEGGQSRWGVGG